MDTVNYNMLHLNSTSSILLFYLVPVPLFTHQFVLFFIHLKVSYRYQYSLYTSPCISLTRIWYLLTDSFRGNLYALVCVFCPLKMFCQTYIFKYFLPVYGVPFHFLNSVLFFSSFIVVLGRGTVWHLHRLLQYIKYIIHQFTPSTILLYPTLPPIPGTVSTRLLFAFTYMCTHFFAPGSPSYPLSPSPPPSHWCQPRPPPQDLFQPPVL
jgi:ACR3 family arsenite efflux pump ArsB